MTAPSAPRQRAHAWIAGALLLVHAAAAWLGRAPDVGASGDDARYILLGRALRHLTYTDTWLATPRPHTLYPPGYPALIGVLGWVFGDAAAWLIFLNVAASTAALALTFVVLRRIWSPAGALAVLAALALNPLLNERAGMIVSEPSAMAAWTAALVLALGAERRHRVAAGLMAILTAAVRAFAIGVPFALAGHWLLQRRLRAAVVLAAIAIAGLSGWFTWTTQAVAVAPNASYLTDLARVPDDVSRARSFALRVARNTLSYATRDIASGVALPGIPGTPADNAVNAIILALGLGAGGYALYRRWRPAALTLGFGLAVLTVWPWRESRYLAPMLPVLVTALLMGIERLVRWRWPRLALPAVVGLAAAMAATGTWHTVPTVLSRLDCDRGAPMPAPACEPPRLHGFFTAVGWLRQHAAADATILAAKPPTVHYYTGQPTADYDRAMQVRPADFGAYARAEGIRLVILSGSHASERVGLANRLEAMCAQLRTAAAFPPSGYVFEIAADSVGQDACEAIRAYRHWVAGTRFDGSGR